MRCKLAITLFLLCVVQAQAEPLGRLFFTPEERAAMDRERLASNFSAPQIPGMDAPAGSITLNGYVKRSGGASTIWLNGKAQREHDASKRMTVTEKSPGEGELAVKFPDSSRIYPLKVGQTLITGSGEIREGYRQAPKSDALPKDPPGAPNQ